MAAGTILGFDLGGTKTSVSRYNAKTWKLEEHQRQPTNAKRGWVAVLADCIALLESFRQQDTIAIGFGVPGPVRQPQGTILQLPNIPGAKNVGLQALLKKRFRLPIAVENDAQCFAYAEAHKGAGKQQPVVVGITMGTGIGGGIVLNGALFRGAHGYAAEIGHTLLMPGKPPYPTTNRRGDTEQFLSGTAFAKRCTAAKTPQEYLEGEVCAFLRPEVFREIAWMCVNVIHTVDPSIIVFGGSVGKSLRPHLKTINKELGKWLLPGTPAPRLAIQQTEHAANLGAALLASKLLDS